MIAKVCGIETGSYRKERKKNQSPRSAKQGYLQKQGLILPESITEQVHSTEVVRGSQRGLPFSESVSLAFENPYVETRLDPWGEPNHIVSSEKRNDWLILSFSWTLKIAPFSKEVIFLFHFVYTVS